MIRRISSPLIVCTLLLGCSRPATVESNPPAVRVAPAPSAAAAPPSTAPALNASAAPALAAPSAEPASTLLAVGAEVPDVSALTQDGKTVHLRALKGKPLVVYFYPKDDTTGCTIEAKGIRDQYKELKSRAVVFGVSSDSQDSHKAFADKYSLPFQLLVDSSHAVAMAFGVPVSAGGYAKR